MDKISQRLETCFARVFSQLTPGEIREASVDSVAQWDSMASITLLSVAGEEFGIEMDMDDFEQFTSFERLLDYVRAHASKG